MKLSALAPLITIVAAATYPSLPVDDYNYCVETSDCRTSTFLCCTVTSATNSANTPKLCVNKDQAKTPNGINLTIGGVSMNLGNSVIACTSADSAKKLALATGAVIISTLYLYI